MPDTRFCDGLVLLIIHERVKYHTTIHSDQAWHYQHNSWGQTLKQNKIFQSISRKTTCADNAAMDNFFDLLKQEIYDGEE
ncbi:DDE-type integrase/transposase/recombinase [Lysinibacillus fusiformis]|jgi:putative transposase|uniref:DDE-type integrase/transposase/recombinase n=1 Tax=Lysinibacillus sp. FSL L8-0312 TaxID=2921521 RepID=UPI0011542AC6